MLLHTDGARRDPVSPSLPQHAGAVGRRVREAALRAARTHYAYTPVGANPMAPVPVAGRAPLRESYNLRWALPYLPQLFRALVATGRYRLAAALERVTGAERDEMGIRDAVLARNWLD